MMTMYRDIIELLTVSHEIVVFTGAGVSTNCGIPDFRGPDGLYHTLKQQYDLPYPEAIFDLGYFQQNPTPFFDLSRNICSENIEPSLAHKFIAWLEQQKKVALVVTQNIDMLHHQAGSEKVIECHGTYRSAHCLLCGKKYQLKDIEAEMQAGSVPYCGCGGELLNLTWSSLAKPCLKHFMICVFIRRRPIWFSSWDHP